MDDSTDADRYGEDGRPEPMPGDSWNPLDLSATIAGLLAGTTTRHTPTVGRRSDGACMFYRGKVNGVAGASGSGKTWTALSAAIQEIEGGEHVLYLDLEDDDIGICGRLLDLGADPDVVLARFHYVSPQESLSLDATANLNRSLSEWAPTLVVVDSTGESMALEGAKPNDDDDTARWFRRIPGAIARTGAAVVVLDHVVKSDDGGLWAIGSQRKRAAINGAQYMQATVTAFSKGEGGMAKIVCAKDRHGNYRAGQKVAELHVTPGMDGTRMELRAPIEGAGAAGSTFRPTAFMERVTRQLEQASGPLTGRTLKALVGGKEEHVVTACRVLADEGYVRIEPGPRKSHLHTLLRLYVQSEDPASDSFRASGVTQWPSSDCPPTPPKERGGASVTQPTPGVSGASVGVSGSLTLIPDPDDDDGEEPMVGVS